VDPGIAAAVPHVLFERVPLGGIVENIPSSTEPDDGVVLLELARVRRERGRIVRLRLGNVVRDLLGHRIDVDRIRACFRRDPVAQPLELVNPIRDVAMRVPLRDRHDHQVHFVRPGRRVIGLADVDLTAL